MDGFGIFIKISIWYAGDLMGTVWLFQSIAWLHKVEKIYIWFCAKLVQGQLIIKIYRLWARLTNDSTK